jgi:feruloyl esterase
MFIGGGAMAQTACSTFNATYNGSGYSGAGAAIATALQQQLGGTNLLLGMTATEFAGGTLDPSIVEPVCQVAFSISSSGNPSLTNGTGSYVNFAAMMPEAGGTGQVYWNGRFLGTGNGGFAGSVPTDELVLGVAEGYAAGTTDMGTGQLFDCDSLFCGSAEGVQSTGQVAGGLYADAPALQDFGYGATHLMTVAAKSLITTFYGTAPAHNYFHGCSTGGQQALMEAQRFPTDYDGILAGSPAYDRTHLHIGGAALYEASHWTEDAYLSDGALSLVHTHVLLSCAGGSDGSLPTDDFLNQPASCTFDAKTLVCGTKTAPGNVSCDLASAGTGPCSCLTADQATTMDYVWRGATDSQKHRLYPGYERGVEEISEDGSANSLGLVWQQSLPEPAFDSLDYWAFGPNFSWTSLFAATNTLQGELVQQIAALDDTPVGTGGATMASTLNANEANLTPFEANGGKLLMYAGYSDPLIPTASTIDYYNLMSANIPNSTSFAELFLAPGLWHCLGGPGANVFGNFTLPPIPTAPSDDILGALVAWRENGVQPKTVIATKYVNDDASQGIAFQRPLCPYPQVAFYDKHQKDPTQAASWSCKMRARVTNQKFYPAYGPVFTPSP